MHTIPVRLSIISKIVPTAAIMAGLMLMAATSTIARAAKPNLDDRIAALEAAVSDLQNEVSALQAQTTDNAAQIAASASTIAANAAAIAANAAAITSNGAAIGEIDQRVSTTESQISGMTSELATIDQRLSQLEQASAASLPVFTNAEDLPTDGSVVVALFEPDGGIYGVSEQSSEVAQRWLMVFDGVSDAFPDGMPGANGTTHNIPPGWYPAAVGASQVEGIVPTAAMATLQDTLFNLPAPAPLGDATIGERLALLADWLNTVFASSNP